MQQLEIVCLVPASRPERVAHVLANFERQTYERKTLLIVENGAAIGAYAETPNVNVVCCDDAHHSSAKNAGIEWLREFLPEFLPDVLCCIMDDDDIYGPEYLTEQAAVAERGVITGKAPGWVMTNEGLQFFHRPPHNQAVCGGSMSFFIEDAQRFPRKVAEEHEFIASAVAAGLKMRVLSPLHFCYERRGEEHAYKMDSRRLWRLFGVYGMPVDAEPLDVIDTIPQGAIQRGIDRRVAA